MKLLGCRLASAGSLEQPPLLLLHWAAPAWAAAP